MTFGGCVGVGGFDVTNSASSHAALAGVLAAIVIGLLPFFPKPDVKDVSDDEPAGRTLSVELLVVAMFLLVISAVVWGGVAGAPSRKAVQNLSPGAHTRIYGEELSRSVTVAGVGTILLALGALCLAAGVLNQVSGRQKLDLGSFIATTLWALSSLAVYEVCFFTIAAASLLWAPRWDVNTASLVVAATASSIGWPRSKRWVLRPSRHVAFLLLSTSGALGVLAYAANPLPSAVRRDLGTTPWDHISVAALCGSAAVAILFMFALTANIRDATQSVPSGR